MGRTELESTETESRLRALEQEIDAERRTEQRQAIRRQRRIKPGKGEMSAGRIVLYTFGAIVTVALITKFIVPLLLLVLLVAAVLWFVGVVRRKK